MASISIRRFTSIFVQREPGAVRRLLVILAKKFLRFPTAPCFISERAVYKCPATSMFIWRTDEMLFSAELLQETPLIQITKDGSTGYVCSVMSLRLLIIRRRPPQFVRA